MIAILEVSCEIRANLNGVIHIVHAKLRQRRLSKEVRTTKDSVQKQRQRYQGTSYRQEKVPGPTMGDICVREKDNVCETRIGDGFVRPCFGQMRIEGQAILI